MVAAIETVAYVGATPWHGLGKRISEEAGYDWQEAMRSAGLDWTVSLVPLVTQDTGVKVPNRAVRRDSDGSILGVVGHKFHVLQNWEAFEWFTPFLDSRQASINTCGALAGGSRIWVLAKLNRDPLVIAPGDEVEKYLLLSHGHDGSLAVRVGFTPVRVVCQNTLSMAHSSEKSKLIRFKHSSLLQANLANVRELVNLANQQFEATAEQYKRLANRSVNQSDLRNYVKLVLGKGEDADISDLSTRMKNLITEVVGYCESGQGNTVPAVRGTWWTAYNGVTEWLSHHRGHNADTRLNALWYGDASKLNQSALELALQLSA